MPVWTSFSDPNLLSLLWLIDSGARISDSMTVPCYDSNAVNFLEEANNCFKSDIDLKSNNVKYFLKEFYQMNIFNFLNYFIFCNI